MKKLFLGLMESERQKENANWDLRATRMANTMKVTMKEAMKEAMKEMKWKSSTTSRFENVSTTLPSVVTKHCSSTNFQHSERQSSEGKDIIDPITSPSSASLSAVYLQPSFERQPSVPLLVLYQQCSRLRLAMLPITTRTRVECNCYCFGADLCATKEKVVRSSLKTG